LDECHAPTLRGLIMDDVQQSRVKALLRRALDSLEYRTAIRLTRRDPLIPPAWLHCVGDNDFYECGEEFFRYFTDIAGLKPHERVLDVGCGTGRMARPLAGYLTSGSYDGIDIVAHAIEWCQRAYERLPNFHFHLADICNQAYNPAGKLRAAEYKFPFADESFDFVYLTSVFTHMLPADMENYLGEVTRVLKPGGRCLITYFLLTPASLKSMSHNRSSIDFKDVLPGCRVKDPEEPEAAVAYEQTKIFQLYDRHELVISEPVHYGKWSGLPEGLSYQDMIIAIRRD
jgi:ubiquinone/menaquinone biosynthesis C-methylase UbiE